MNQPTQPSQPPSLRVPRFENSLPCVSGSYHVVTMGHGPVLLRVGRVRFEGDPEIGARPSRQRETQRAVNALHSDRSES